MSTLTDKIKNIRPSIGINLQLVIFILLVSSLTRIALMIMNFKEIEGVFYMIPISLIMGIIFDLFIALCVTFPIVLLLTIYPARWKRFFFFKIIAAVSWFIFIFGNLYLAVVEIVFFNEFSSRFNYVAVDYLIYPHEVFINIWDTYPVLTILIVTFIVSLLITLLTVKKLSNRLQSFPQKFGNRLKIILSYGLLIVLLYFSLNINMGQISDNRILNEISLNGIYSFFYAGFTNNLDYNQYYKTMDFAKAVDHVKQMINDNNTTFPAINKPESIERTVKSDRDLHRFNIVLVLEESFGSDFIGTLTPDGPNLTPRFDSLCDQHGMLFSHVYATGNRTVRGLEASLLSFPPIPGRSIVKRPGSENVFSLPSVLKNMGYNTVFLYGGLSYFDNFGHFAATNNFDAVIDELKFKNPIFSTIWGVCDEDLFNKALNVFDSLDTENKPFFATLITVSNHSPYTYPKGRIPFDPEEKRRENSVRYADYAIGKFLNDAQSHKFYDSTLFIFQADHGARVYGSEEIPLRSYRIPIMFYNPVLIPEGTRVNILGSQMDLSPTILDFLGFEYNSMFFGRSLLATTDNEARVLMSHDRDVSLLKNDTLVVLNIMKQEELWRFDTTNTIQRIDDTISTPLETDAISYYMTAYNMFKNHDLHPLEQPTTMIK